MVGEVVPTPSAAPGAFGSYRAAIRPEGRSREGGFEGETLVSPIYPVIRDEAAIAAVEEYVRLQARVASDEARLKELRPSIEAAMAGAPQACAGYHVLTLTHVPALPATPNRVIDESMIGQVLPGKRGRAAHTQLRVQ